EILETVPRNAFYPEPKVDSSIVRITPKPPPFKVEDEEHFFKLVRVLFAHRRKKIGNSLILAWKEFFDSPEEMRRVVSRIPKTEKRVEQLSPEEIGELSNSILQGKV
ncbi:MAG: rRNA adenine N-6-methyltransferase family protein, partial [Thermoplasmata archaeon]